MSSRNQIQSTPLVFDENVAMKKNTVSTTTEEMVEQVDRSSLRPTEHLENKENWDPETGVFVGGSRFTSPMPGKKKGLSNARRPLGELKVPSHNLAGLQVEVDLFHQG